MCELWLEQVAFLGHIISKEGLSVNLMMVEGIKNFPLLTNITEIRDFLGLVGYYWKFVERFSKIATFDSYWQERIQSFSGVKIKRRVFKN